jgi:hypothetical protein
MSKSSKTASNDSSGDIQPQRARRFSKFGCQADRDTKPYRGHKTLRKEPSPKKRTRFLPQTSPKKISVSSVPSVVNSSHLNKRCTTKISRKAGAPQTCKTAPDISGCEIQPRRSRRSRRFSKFGCHADRGHKTLQSPHPKPRFLPQTSPKKISVSSVPSVVNSSHLNKRCTTKNPRKAGAPQTCKTAPDRSGCEIQPRRSRRFSKFGCHADRGHKTLQSPHPKTPFPPTSLSQKNLRVLRALRGSLSDCLPPTSANPHPPSVVHQTDSVLSCPP